METWLEPSGVRQHYDFGTALLPIRQTKRAYLPSRHKKDICKLNEKYLHEASIWAQIGLGIDTLLCELSPTLKAHVEGQSWPNSTSLTTEIGRISAPENVRLMEEQYVGLRPESNRNNGELVNFPEEEENGSQVFRDIDGENIIDGRT